jgi:hypothetical protein
MHPLMGKQNLIRTKKDYTHAGHGRNLYNERQAMDAQYLGAWFISNKMFLRMPPLIRYVLKALLMVCVRLVT